MVEAVTWSFVSKPQAELFGGGKPELALANPIAADLSDMRPSLLPGLIAAAQKNADRGFPDVALFEVGQIFRGDQPAGPVHRGERRAARARQGERRRPALVEPGARGRCVRRQGRCACGAGRCWRTCCCSSGRAGRAGVVPSGALGHHPDRAAECAWPFRRAASARARSDAGRGTAGRLRGDPGEDSRGQGRRRRAPSRCSSFRRSSRSSAISHSWSIARVKAGDIVRTTQAVDRKLITGVTVFDVYEGQGIDPGKKSIAIAVTLAAAREDHDRPGDRRGRRQDRRRGRQAHRRRAAGVVLRFCRAVL